MKAISKDILMSNTLQHVDSSMTQKHESKTGKKIPIASWVIPLLQHNECEGRNISCRGKGLRKEMKVSECIIQGAEEDGGCLQKKDEIITSFNARPTY